VAARSYRAGVPRRRVPSLRHRDGAVRGQVWPFGDFTSSGMRCEQYPSGYFTSVRWGVLARLVLVYGLLLFALVVGVALVATAVD
jgi:hypothetical protein